MSSSNEVGVVLVEEEEGELVDPVDANSALYDASMVVRRAGRFLKPRAACPEEAGGLPLVQPLLREVVSAGLVKNWPPEVVFRGWSAPSGQWSRWVWKLKPLHENLWVETGIYDAVVASTCDFQRDDATMIGLLECWCPETNTFVLPWPSVGVEATVTLEDIMILGGFPVLGEPVESAAAPPAGEAGELLGGLVAVYRSLMGQCSLHRVTHTEWICHHMQVQVSGGDGDGGGSLEHAAFLSLWLSRFVFPCSTVLRDMFPIAARLAVGERVALGPAVLASLYRDLRLMKQRALAEGICNGATSIPVRAPLHILQLWAWERFGSLRPEKTPHFLHMDEPRAARWRCSDAQRRDFSSVRSVLESPAEFRWRPYADIVDDWGRPSYHRHVGRWFDIGVGDSDSLPSFLLCLRAGELVGLDCTVCYAPHRVAMQFGLDQDLPARIPHDDTTWELNWSAYDEGTKKVKFYVSSHFCKPRATQRFLKWQKEWMSARMVEVEKIAVEQVEGVWKGRQLSCERKHRSLCTEHTRKKPAGTISMAATSAAEQPVCTGEGGTCTTESSSTYAEEETMNNNECKEMEIVKSNGDGEACSGDQVNFSFEESVEDLVGEKCEDAYTDKGIEENSECNPTEMLRSNRDGEAHSGDHFDSTFQKSTEDLLRGDFEIYDYEQLEQFIIQELEKVDPPVKTKKRKRVVDNELQRQKDLEFDREIQKLKAEIRELEGQLTKLKSEDYVETKER